MKYIYIKRLLDIIVSFILILLMLPIFLILTLLIIIDSKGPVLFFQTRIGKNQKKFKIYKFRTMRYDSPKDTPSNNLSDSDKWITKFGSFLRKTSLDEIPQLLNIFIGDMSFVGPRPALWNEFDLINLREVNDVYTVKPGLTGLAQISGRNNISLKKKVALDTIYVNNINFMLDFKIFLKTFKVIYDK